MRAKHRARQTWASANEKEGGGSPGPLTLPYYYVLLGKHYKHRVPIFRYAELGTWTLYLVTPIWMSKSAPFCSKFHKCKTGGLPKSDRSAYWSRSIWPWIHEGGPFTDFMIRSWYTMIIGFLIVIQLHYQCIDMGDWVKSHLNSKLFIPYPLSRSDQSKLICIPWYQSWLMWQF